MDTRRVRILAGSALAASLLTWIWVGAAVAADCLLSGPAAVNVGTQLTITGAGFPASSSVDISLSVAGGSSDAFTVQSNTEGALQINLIPEATDAGVTTIKATSGPDCSAQLVVTVLGAGQTLPPTPSPASAGAGASAEATAPRTDVAGGSTSDLAATTTNLWLGAALILGIGLSGVVATRVTWGRRPLD